MNYSDYVQSQVSVSDWELLQAMNLNLNHDELSGFWTDIVDFEKRRQTEVPFLVEQLQTDHSIAVLDTCMGAGATTIGLLLAEKEGEFSEGLEVFANEHDKSLAEVARRELQKYGLDFFDVTNHDWFDLAKEYIGDELKPWERLRFDAVLCLGNSLTYFFRREDQLRALENFRDILKDDGKLIIDERNYAEHFLADPSGARFRHSRNILYCGENVTIRPRYISDTMVVLEDEHVSGAKAHIVVYPFKAGEMRSLLEEVGFSDIQVYGDYKLGTGFGRFHRGFNPKTPEFLTYVCRR